MHLELTQSRRGATSVKYCYAKYNSVSIFLLQVYKPIVGIWKRRIELFTIQIAMLHTHYSLTYPFILFY